MTTELSAPLRFDSPDLMMGLPSLPRSARDALDFGLVQLSQGVEARVAGYNAYESRRSGLSPESVLGLPFFGVVAQCMNNYLVAQRFEDASASRGALDETLAYVLTLRMRPTPVTLRLLASPSIEERYVLIDWPAPRSGS